MSPSENDDQSIASDSGRVDRRKYWFPAKRYGWGWGFPSAWQGWIVLGGFVCFLILAGCWLASSENVTGYLMAVFTATALLLLICYRQGEPPQWRWGSSKDCD